MDDLYSDLLLSQSSVWRFLCLSELAGWLAGFPVQCAGGWVGGLVWEVTTGWRLSLCEL